MTKRLAIVCGLALTMMTFSAVRAADAKTEKTVSGVLIDQHCGKKMLKKEHPQEAAAGHEKSCTLKCGKKDGYAVISDDKEIKLDKASNEKVQDYLAKEDASTKVTVKGTENDNGTLSVTSIEPEAK